MTGEQTPLRISRDFADGATEAWSSRTAGHWKAYLQDIVLGLPKRGPAPVALRLRMANGQLVIIRPKRLGKG